MVAYFNNHPRRVRFPWSIYHRGIGRRLAAILRASGPAPRVLVVGCGLEPIIEGGPPGATYFGCDVDPRAIDACREAFPEMSDRLAVCPSDDALPDEGAFREPFDVVIAKEVIEHVVAPASWAQALSTKVRPGGSLVLTTPNYGRFSTLPLLEATILELVARRDGYSRRDIHPSRFNPESLAALDTGPGMALVGVETTWTRWAMVGRWTRVRDGAPASHGSGAEATNRDYYAQLSTGRDDYWRKMAAPRFRVATFLRLLSDDPPASLVDLGCGNGLLLAEIRERHPSMALSGVDLSDAQIAANRKAQPGLGWHAMDLDRPLALAPELRDRFEAVVASEVIEHVREPRTFLANALRMATPGHGRLLLSTQSGQLRETERRVGHLRHFTASAMRRLLIEAGWEPVRVWNSGFPFHDLSKWYANRNPDATMRRFGGERYGLREDLVCWGLRAAFRLNSDRRGAQLFAVARRA